MNQSCIFCCSANVGLNTAGERRERGKEATMGGEMKKRWRRDEGDKTPSWELTLSPSVGWHSVCARVCVDVTAWQIPLSCYPINTPHNWNKSYQCRRLNQIYRMIDPNKDTKNFFFAVFDSNENFLLQPLQRIIQFTAYLSVLNTSTELTYLHAVWMQFGLSLNTWNSFSKVSSRCSWDQKLIWAAAGM